MTLRGCLAGVPSQSTNGEWIMWIEQLKAEGFALEVDDFKRVRKGPVEALGWTSHWHCWEGDAWAEARRHRNLNRPHGEPKL